MAAEYSWSIASTVLLTVGFVIATIFFVLSLRYVKTHHDAARKTFTYMKLALGFLALGSALHTAGEAIITHFIRPDAWEKHSFTEFDHARKASVHLIEIGDLFLVFTDIAIILSLAYLDRGISTVQNGGTSTRGASIVARAALGVAGVAGVLYFVSWCMATYFNTEILNDLYGTGAAIDLVDLWYALRGMRLAYWAVMVLATIALVVRSVMVAIRKDVVADANTASFFFLACSALYLPRPIYMFIAWVRAIHEMVTGTPSQLDELWVGIMYVIFGYYPLVIVLVALFFLGRKQLYGIWSDGRYGTKYSATMTGPHAHYVSP